MKILHFTDIHLTAPGTAICGRDPALNFERALDHAFVDHADADLLAITGDLSDWGDREDYVRLKDRISRIEMPIALCIGNHDDRTTFQSVFPEFVDEFGFVQSVHDLPGARALFLDTWGPETHSGHYCAKRLNWLDAQLSDHPGPFLIFMHHNPIPTHMGPVDQIMLKDHAAFRSVIANHAIKIRQIYFGHCHMPIAGACAGVPIVGIRGTNHASLPVFSERDMLANADLPETYGVSFIGEDYITSHMVEFGYAGEIRIEGSPDYATWDRATMER